MFFTDVLIVDILIIDKKEIHNENAINIKQYVIDYIQKRNSHHIYNEIAVNQILHHGKNNTKLYYPLVRIPHKRNYIISEIIHREE